LQDSNLHQFQLETNNETLSTMKTIFYQCWNNRLVTSAATYKSGSGQSQTIPLY